MSGTVADKKRLLRVTAGNLKNNHLYINGHFDFFPQDSIGPSKAKKRQNGNIEIYLEGLNETLRHNKAEQAA
jgi:hypothetical protein